MCCATGCRQTVGGLQDLAASAMASPSASAVKACPFGHSTQLQPLVGMVSVARDGHEAELQYWLHTTESMCSEAQCGEEDIILPPHMCTSLASALVKWSASTLQEDISRPSVCPRVWVAVCHRDASLVLRPVCEHPECLHAMRFKRRGCGIVADVLHPSFARARHVHAPPTDTGVEAGTAAKIPLRQLAMLSGRALAVLTQDAEYGDEAMQSCMKTMCQLA